MNVLKSERGSSVVEFLICGPILALLTYVAYDMNRRIENQQTVTIAARNAVVMGEAFSQAQLDQKLRKQLDVESQILDAKERAAVTASAFVRVDPGHSLGDVGYSYGRIEGAPGVQTGGTSGGSSFDTLSQSTGSVGSTMALALQKVEGAGETIGIFIPDRIRSAGVETAVPGSTNGIQTAIGVLSEHVTNNKDSKTQVFAVERRFGQRFYLRQESGYHPNGYDSFDFVGVVVGAGKDRWGDGDKFSDTSTEIQTRCMTRFYVSNDCGSGSADHEFYDQVRGIAVAKGIIALALRVCAKVPIVGPVCEGVIEGIQVVTGIAVAGGDAMLAVTDLVGQLSSLLDKGVPGFDSGVESQLASPQFVNEFVSGMDPSLVKKVGG